MTLILTVLLSLGFAVTSFALITGSKHDLSRIGSAAIKTVNTEICIYCHTPHAANDDARLDYNPLWNMETTDVVFTAYDSTTFDIGLTQADPLIGPSRLCMSCHDGTIATDSAISGTELINKNIGVI